MKDLEVVEAGTVSYGDALEWQRELAADRIAGRLDHDVLLLLEHPPVVTLGRTSHASHLLQPDGIDVFEVERGGDVTFHGPGQLVGYPILDLGAYKKDLHWYLRTLEQALIHALALLNIPAERNPGLTGVWTHGRKIASIGIHVKQWVRAQPHDRPRAFRSNCAVRDSGRADDIRCKGAGSGEQGAVVAGECGGGGERIRTSIRSEDHSVP